MASLEDLEARLAALEDRLGMEAGLRASQDRDLSRIAAATDAGRHLLQALSITQSEHTQTLAEHTERLDRIESTVRAGFHSIATMLQTLIDREAS